jgi:hypothetical protein
MILMAVGVFALSGVAYWMPKLKETVWGRSNAVFRTSLDFVAGMIVGVTLTHFVVDAGPWRLRAPSVRAYVAQRFGFLFETSRAPGPPSC